MYLLQVRCPIAQYADLYRRGLCRIKRDNSTFEKRKKEKEEKKKRCEHERNRKTLGVSNIRVEEDYERGMSRCDRALLQNRMKPLRPINNQEILKLYTTYTEIKSSAYLGSEMSSF